MTGMTDVPSRPKVPWWQRVAVGGRPRWTLIRLLILVVGSWFTLKFWLLPVRVTGISMEPAYRDGQVNFINRLAYRRQEPVRGDVVGLRTTGVRVLILKRVIGLPGELIELRDGWVYINGVLLDEPYVPERARWRKPPTRLGPDEFLVIGDNRKMPERDHAWGIVPRDRIVGRILR
jgi:signal peptidase I